jgi:hypothetical protein
LLLEAVGDRFEPLGRLSLARNGWSPPPTG